ncbi:MAG TPA: hypothetical protein VKZ46_01405 [Pedomonas sp.]|nr:hypothetical protein [Pedomonas sp.]
MPFDNTVPCEPINDHLLRLALETVAAVHAKLATTQGADHD